MMAKLLDVAIKFFEKVRQVGDFQLIMLPASGASTAKPFEDSRADGQQPGRPLDTAVNSQQRCTASEPKQSWENVRARMVRTIAEAPIRCFSRSFVRLK